LKVAQAKQAAADVPKKVKVVAAFKPASKPAADGEQSQPPQPQTEAVAPPPPSEPSSS
jgi:hypothetical protein